MILRSLFFFVVTFLLLNTVLVAQNQMDSGIVFESVKTTEEIGEKNIYQPDKTDKKDYSPLSSYEFYLSLIVLGFGVFALLVEVLLIYKQKISQDNIIKFVIVTLIITATLFLITAGYSNDQIAPAMGLLGTIAGYLLGKSKGESKPVDKSTN